jgi:tetratricopeptide (TPR) repeat protein
VEEGVETCSCGTHFIVSEEEKMKAVYSKEEKLVNVYRDYESIALESFEAEDYAKSLEYSNKAIELNLGSDAFMKYTKGKSLFYLNRYYDCIQCFKDYIDEYENSFYRFSNISGAYHWKARAQWALGDSFGSIKSYYKALDNVEKKNGSNDYKNEIRFKIQDEKQQVINSSKGVGIYNPKLGNIDYDVHERLEKIGFDLNYTMQNLYDVIDETESEDCKFKSLSLNGDDIIVSFECEDSTVEKTFDGSNEFKD